MGLHLGRLSHSSKTADADVTKTQAKVDSGIGESLGSSPICGHISSLTKATQKERTQVPMEVEVTPEVKDSG